MWTMDWERQLIRIHPFYVMKLVGRPRRVPWWERVLIASEVLIKRILGSS
jgi:hypothetical protein